MGEGLGRGCEVGRGVDYRQLVTPSVVAMAVRIEITT